jgi:hypothetical protein
MIVKVATVHEIPYDTIYVPGIKTGSKVVIIKEPTYSLINMKEMTISPAIRTPIKPGFAAISSLTAASIGVDFSDDTLIVIPIEKSKKHYAFVYKDKHKRKFVCINVSKPKNVHYFPIVWDNKNIPNGLDSIITRIEDANVGGGCIWNNTTGLMVLNMDDPHVKSDIEKFGFEENVRICMGYSHADDDYQFEYTDESRLSTDELIYRFSLNNPLFEQKPEPMMTKYVSDGTEKFPILVNGKFNEKMNSMLCKEVSFSITLGFNSTITGIGTLVFGAGGNTKELIIVVDDREMTRMSDMRFTEDDINKMKSFIITTRRNLK